MLKVTGRFCGPRFAACRKRVWTKLMAYSNHCKSNILVCATIESGKVAMPNCLNYANEMIGWQSNNNTRRVYRITRNVFTWRYGGGGGGATLHNVWLRHSTPQRYTTDYTTTLQQCFTNCPCFCRVRALYVRHSVTEWSTLCGQTVSAWSWQVRHRFQKLIINRLQGHHIAQISCTVKSVCFSL